MLYQTHFRLTAFNLLSFLAVSSLSFIHTTSLGPKTAFAADTPEYNNVQIWVEPEYDDPRLLVMIEGKIASKLGDKTPVKFLVPQDAEMYSAGSLDAKGNYTGGPPGRTPSATPGFDEISYDLTSDTFRIEYYQDSIRGAADKSIDFEFRTLYPITGLVLSVQQPLKASNFRIDPASQSTSKAANFTYYEYRYPSVASDKPIRLAVNYTKADPAPSISPGTAPLQNGSNDSSRLDLTWPLIGAGVIGIGLAAYWLGKQRSSGPVYGKRQHEGAGKKQKRSPTPPAPQHALRNEKKSGGKPSTVQVSERTRVQAKGTKKERSCSFCRQFVEGDDQFCPYCGTELND